jgi:hypothetical protein
MSLALYRIYHPASADLGWCGDILVHTTRSILKIRVPIGISAATGLGLLARRGVGRRRPVAIVVLAVAVCLVALIVFLIWSAPCWG